jgi:superfamily II DNA or RNA helicase
MFLNNAIYKYINSEVDASLHKRGAEIKKSGFVKNIQHFEKAKFYSSDVMEMFDVKVYYENAFRIIEVTCNCPSRKPCEHGAATLYQMLGMKDDEFLVGTDKSDNKKSTEKPKIVKIEPQVQIKKNGLLDFKRASDFRIIPADNIKTLTSIMSRLRPAHPKTYGYGTEYSNILHESGELDIKVLKRSLHYNWNEEKEYAEQARVTFKNRDGQILTKCNACIQQTDVLCDHQYVVLTQVEFQKLIFSGLWFDYNALAKKLADNKKISLEKFKALYSINFVDGVPTANLSNKNFLDYDKLTGLTREIRELKFGEKDEISEMLTAMSGKSTEVKKNALLWVIEENDEPMPILIEGVVPKTKDRLSSKIETTEEPLYFNDEELKFYDHLKVLQKKYGDKYLYQYKHIFIRTLKENIETLKNIIHYFTIEYDEYEKLKKKDLEQFTFSDQLVSLIAETNEDQHFYHLQLHLKIADRIIDTEKEELFFDDSFLILENKAYLFEDSSIMHFFNSIGNKPLTSDKDNPAPLLDLLHELHQKFEVKYPGKYQPVSGELGTPVKELYLKEAGEYVLIQPKLAYDETMHFIVPNEDRYINETTEDGTLIIYEPDPEDIAGFCHFLAESHPSLKTSYDTYGSFYIHTLEMIKNAWFLSFFESCRNEGINIFGQETLKNFRFNTNPANISMGIASGIDWFDVNVEVMFGSQKASLRDWVDSIKNNEKYIRLDDGSLGFIPEDWFEKLKQVVLLAEEEKGKLKMNKFRMGAIDLLFEEIADDELKSEINQKLRQLNDYEFKKEYQLPSNLQAKPREYQVMGYQWLKALSDLGFGGCLADDMGLGKTLQILSLLADQKAADKGTSLAVVPRSLLFNWAAEIEKFCPSLTFINYHGLDRVTKRDDIFNYDLIITTYDTATNDIEFFRGHTFNYVILDESQAIKNPNSKRYKAMRLLKATNRIVMTGTPIENNTFDLYAQFSFLNPGIFGSQQNFRNSFALPIDKNNDQDAAMMLRKIINPFLLRRTKEQVAKDLPERTENVIYCEMGKAQRDYYDALKIRIREDLENNIKKEGFNKARFKIIEGLLRLRQVCNSPQLVDPTLHRQTSVKIETLMDIIANDLGNHNALIFSQFTTMLDLIRKELDKNNIPYAYLDGSTRDRKAAVEHFEKNDHIQLFLISLKAGNTGLNLIKADYVYLVDPWWNPAVEAQAIDRTHRIGQVKNVFAYRMICKNTIEEKILELQGKKKKLAGDLVVTDENVFKSLEKDELMGLFL